jgi:hypothetical protein
MPIKWPWDHAIDLKDDFVLKDCKIYPMSPIEQEKRDEFIDKNMWKGYIRPSKSPMASPFFFVSKKESAKLWPTQDYRQLNLYFTVPHLSLRTPCGFRTDCTDHVSFLKEKNQF